MARFLLVLVSLTAMTPPAAADAPDDDVVVTTFLRLQHAPVGPAATLLQQFVSDGGDVTPYPKARTLAVTDTRRNIRRLRKLLGAVDVPRGAQTSKPPIIEADPRTNQLIIVTDPVQYRRTDRLIRRLDRPGRGDRSVFVRKLRHTSVKDIQPVLDALFNRRGKRRRR